MTQARLKRVAAGDLVEVRPAREILGTLDAGGTLGGLVFMPEMLEYCGRRFRVSRRAEQGDLDSVSIQRDIPGGVHTDSQVLPLIHGDHIDD